ncbi:hypothetical protein E4U13_001867 [Claviceps humidiphila]|uniref:Uncharacterized protein n=1 Tax=Claviceps humidiphila TaxID=1294629 RepID=A0A9P7PZM0_9HYPO|nr:hypothetical protein E4U13_001867 [Claviceps humidiphila]
MAMGGSMPGFAAMSSAGSPLRRGPLQGPPSSGSTTNNTNTAQMYPRSTLGKRKHETQESNERLSKRMSLLNIERNGTKLYVPVESQPQLPPPNTHPNAYTYTQPPPHANEYPYAHPPTSSPAQASPPTDYMQLDDSKHKVYIYSLDDEITSESSEDEDGKLIFLPDIEKHLREKRIPPHILADSDGQLGGMQLVLYSDPKSLSVPEEQDGVRKAIIEARQRAREKQRLEREGAGEESLSGMESDGDAMDLD